MADTTKDIWNDDDGEEALQKKSHRFRRFLIFSLVLVVVLVVVLLAAYRDGTGFDVLRRYFTYGETGEESDSGYQYDASSSNRFAVLGERLVVLSNTSLQVLSADGSEVWSTSVKMNTPALAVGGGRAAAYDVGGTELYVVDSEGEQMTLTADPSEPFLAATLNDDGWLAVTAERDNCKGAVDVYSAQGDLMFTFRSSQRFVTDAYVTDDDSYLAAVTLGQEDSVFVSNIVLYDLTETEPVADYDISDGLVLEISQQDNRIVTVSDTVLTLADSKGTVEGSYSYGGEYLREYDTAGDDFTVLLLNRYQSGSLGRLVTVDEKGEEIASLDISDEVVGLSAAGRYIAVLYIDHLEVYNQDLQTYATLEDTGYARDILMRSDGSVLLLASESARLFLP